MSDQETEDWGTDVSIAQATPDAAALSRVQDLAARGRRLEQGITATKEALVALNSEYHHLRTVELPDAMDALGMAKFTASDGTAATLEPLVDGGLPKRDLVKRHAALEYLRTLGAEGLVRTELSLNFAKDNATEATEAITLLTSIGYPPNVKEDVNTQSLRAFARERLRNGEPLVPERLGLHIGRVVRFRFPAEGEGSSS